MQDNWLTGHDAIIAINHIDLCVIPIVHLVRKCANKKCEKHLAHGNKDTLCFTCRRIKTRKTLGLDRL